MRILDAAAVDGALDDIELIDRLDALFRTGCEMPVRHHHAIREPLGAGSAEAMLLLMPAWTQGSDSRIGVKIVTVFPDNARQSLPAIFGQYLLLDGRTGRSEALHDGTVLTKRRTACASGLAARYLAPLDARRLAMLGTGALAPHLVRVHAKVRPIEAVQIWGRTPAHADALAVALRGSLPRDLGRAIAVEVARDREHAVRWADVVSCATLSKTPLVEGAWLRPGQHVDLVGAYNPGMRESDDEAVRRAAVFVDTRAGATKEAGDIVQALQSGVLQVTDIRADLHDLARGLHGGRSVSDRDGITLFKSVGAALEDLAAAVLAVEKHPIGGRHVA
jgi:alanine dehydrogenase